MKASIAPASSKARSFRSVVTVFVTVVVTPSTASVSVHASPTMAGPKSTSSRVVVAARSISVPFGALTVWGSLASASVPVPPYGTIGISLAPGLYFEFLPPFVLGGTGTIEFPLTVPNDPNLLLATFYLQALGGPPARLQLSNVAVLTFM